MPHQGGEPSDPGPTGSPRGAPKPSPLAPGPDAPPFGKYRLIREAGRGAMAVVYEALDPELQRRVALKMVHTSPNADAKEAELEEERFVREARLTANLPKHPHIVGVYDAGVIDGRRFIAMEFIEGRSMDEWRKQGSMVVQRPVGVLRDAALAVHHAHEHGVIHRDLKPANILVDAKNEPHVTDFGLAKAIGQNLKLSYTEAGLVVGTPGYMSPEQAQGLKSLDRRTDVYSLGVMLYEILTGRVPFRGDSAVEIMLKTVKDPVVPPSKITTVQINPFVFKNLEGICLKALAKDPGHRYPTALAMAEDLTRWLAGEEVRVDLGKPRRLLVGLSASIAGALLVLGMFFLRSGKPTSEADLARADLLMAEGRVEEALALYRQVAGREKENRRAAAGEKGALARIREKEAPKPPEDPWKNAIDLLPRVDLGKDVVSGTWAEKEGVFWSYSGTPSRLQVPYRPPGEYDVRLEFSRRGSNVCIDLILSKSGKAFALVLHRQGVFGFERVHGQDFGENASFIRTGASLAEGRRYTALVEVRDSGVTAFIDGEPISRWKTDYSDLTMHPSWKLPDPAALGVGAWEGTAIIRRFQVREVTGKGDATRPSSPKKN